MPDNVAAAYVLRGEPWGELTLLVIAVTATASLFGRVATPHKRLQRALRLSVTGYAVSTIVTCWATLLLSTRDHPDRDSGSIGIWCIILLDLSDGLIYAFLYLFLAQKVWLAVERSPDEPPPPPWLHRSYFDRAAHVLAWAGSATAGASLVVGVVGPIANTHVKAEGVSSCYADTWIISVCRNCLPSVAISLVALLVFPLASFAAAHARAERLRSSGCSLEDCNCDMVRGAPVPCSPCSRPPRASPAHPRLCASSLHPTRALVCRCAAPCWCSCRW